MSYATATEIYNVLKFFRPDLTVDFVTSDIHDIATAEVDSSLVERGIYSETALTDIKGQLKMAEICFFMELMANMHVIEAFFGDVQEEQKGKKKTVYASATPMFFMTGSSSAPFIRLLPHETFRMAGNRYTETYGKMKFIQDKGRINAYGHIVTDRSYRGYGWDDEETTPYRSWE